MAKTALVIVDMVRDFTDPEGLVFYPEKPTDSPADQKVLDESRKHDLLVVFLQHCNRKDKLDRKAQSMRPNCIEGTFGIEIDPMLKVDEKKDYVIRKRRYSGFFATDLDLVLRGKRGGERCCCRYQNKLLHQGNSDRCLLSGL